MSDSASLGSAIATLKPRWGWCLALGIALLIAGIIALLTIVAATVVTVWWVGAMMILAGIFEIAHGFRMKDFGRAILWTVIGALYVFGGVFAMVKPILVRSTTALPFVV